MAVELWATRLERPLTEQETAEVLQMLPAERQERLLRLRWEEKRQEPLCAYLLLYLALAARKAGHLMEEIRVSPGGKPYFPGQAKLHFNLSHTNGAALVGISDRPVGVDIEKIRDLSPRTAKRLTGETSEDAFFKDWVRREAIGKLRGEGVGKLVRGEVSLRQGEYYYEIPLFPEYAAGAATLDGAVPGRVNFYTLDELLQEQYQRSCIDF